MKSAIALSLVVLALGCRGDSVGAVERAATGSGSGSGHVAEALSQIVATCAETVGTTEVRRKGQVRWEPVGIGATFRERDWVRTGPRGFARLRFGTRGFLDLGENTTLLVDSAITIESGTVVGVAEGQEPLLVSAGDGSHARLEAGPGGPVEFRLVPLDTKGVEIAVTKGSLRVITKTGERIVAAGEATDLAGQVTGDVVKLLGYPKSLSPGVDARFLFAPDLHVALKWTRVEGAVRYHFQIARDTEFRKLLMTGETTTPDSSLSPDREGVYVWRVAARDARGRLGEYGFARRIYCENDEPRDLLIAPRDAFKVEFAKTPPEVEFSWRPTGDAKKYKVIIDRGEAGSEPVVSTTTSAQRLAVTLEEGTYNWGVYALKDDYEEPIFLSLRRLTIKKLQGPKLRTEVQWNQPKP